MRRLCDERLEEGFTLLELIVVIAVIGVIVGVAVPMFFGVRSRAQDTAAQADLRTALVAANTAYIDTDQQTLGQLNLDLLTAAEPGIHWAADSHTTGVGSLAAYPGVVQETGNGAIGLAVDAGDGKCWFAFQSDNEAPQNGWASSSGGCDATQAAQFASATTFPA